MIRDGGVQRSQPLPVVEHEDEARGEDSHHVDAQGEEEEEEVAVVPAPDAVVHPGAVVVKVLRVENDAAIQPTAATSPLSSLRYA